VVILTYNSILSIEKLLKSLYGQVGVEYSILVIDSESTDGTVKYIRNESNVRLEKILAEKFDHGGTRNYALSLVSSKYIVFLTHDVVFADKFGLARLYEAIESQSDVKAAYGRQRVDSNAKYYSRLLREFNYPPCSRIQNKSSHSELGIKTIFLSNSYSIYDVEYIKAIGGFPERVIFGEDMIIASTIIDDGQSICYEGSSEVIHYHSYSMKEEFKRSFDTGYMHTEQVKKLFKYNNSESTALEYIKYQIRWLFSEGSFVDMVDFLVRTTVKSVGYILGKNGYRFPAWLNTRLSMNKKYFGTTHK
jgi:rhamnosyltransferase